MDSKKSGAAVIIRHGNMGFLAWLSENIFCFLLATLGAFALRMLEWPCWQNPEYSLRGEMLLATHDAYHWVAGAAGYGLAIDHPMAVMLRTVAGILHQSPANTAFWFPAVLASLVAGIVYLWANALGARQAGVAAGIIASMAPGFLGRTLLGYYDTDLVTLFFPLLIALAPACWTMRFMYLPGAALARLAGNLGFRRLRKKKHKKADNPAIHVNLPVGNPLSWPWLVLLALSGIIAWWTQQWHSVFPYLIRFNVILPAVMALVMAPRGRRKILCAGALAYGLPALAGPWGLVLPACMLAAHANRKLEKLFQNIWIVGGLWLLVLCLVLSGGIFETIINQLNAYLKHTGDTHASGGAALVFPSVAQSIIEVQDLRFAALFPYFHPWLEAAIFGMAGFILVLFRRPGALFLLPLAALAFLSSRLGGRMVMFGAPIVAIGLTLPCYWLLSAIFRRLWQGRASGWIACIILCALFVAPFAHMIPELSQGPIINRRHAAALAEARSITPEDAKLWLWWDWGYAAHYFARRSTIADGAQHGGPSLYLPAAVFATHNARFARQIIRRTSACGNEPGNFFRDMQADKAQELINRLRSAETPLVAGRGRQYVIVSFEMLRLGFWISNFGNWNFVTCQGEGGALSIVPQALAYKLNSGEVRLEDSSSIILPTSISVFAETGVISRNYVQEWFDAHPDATVAQQRAWLQSRRNVNFLFNRVTDEKLAMDEGIYRSLMVQLLLCDPHDPRFSPYFRLVYDNVFARIYEVLPDGEPVAAGGLQ